MNIRHVCAAGLLVAAGAMNGCASAPRTAFTEAEDVLAEPVGAPGVRTFADQASAKLDVAKRVVAFKVATQPASFLALSGGGADGAFGAGILTGWTRSGRRPEFTIVSGVSTGALIAPFAYLGPAYDDVIQKIYTEGYGKQLVAGANPLSAVFGESLVGSQKLLDLVARFTDERLLDAIAAEHKRGRRLYILTTNLDAQRGTIWDLGQIATRGPRALPLFRKVIAASASVPGLFEPVLIDVTTDGRVFQEMHVDGTTISQILTAPDKLLAEFSGVAKSRRAKNLYILINGKVDAAFEVVKPTTVSVSTRSLSTNAKQTYLSNAVAAYQSARAAGLNYNLVYMDRSISQEGSSGFDTAYMRGLYDYGYKLALNGDFWRHTPPPLETPVPVAPRTGLPAAPTVASAAAEAAR